MAEVLHEKGGKLMWSEDRAASELCEFARNGDLERIKTLALCGCPLSSADYDGRTCLHLAASVGNRLIVQALLDGDADLNFADRWGGTPLADAVREGHRDIASVLIESGAELGFDEGKASSALCELAKGGDLDKVKLLLSGGCDANAADCHLLPLEPRGPEPPEVLYSAAHPASLPRVLSDDKRTCLHLSASTGNLHVVEELLKANANVNCMDRWGGTPLVDAMRV